MSTLVLNAHSNPKAAMNLPVAPFQISIPDAVIDDLRRRIRDTRWPPRLGEADGRYGVLPDELRELAEAWTTFDWRGTEARMNRLPQFRVTLQGQAIHFLHVRGRGPAPMPLVLTHGWPWTFWDMRRVIGPLTDPARHGGDPLDAFDLVVPSLPGFGFSSPRHGRFNFWKTADLWRLLMVEALGYPRFAAAGGDWGALVSAQLGHKHADVLHGIHLTQPLAPDAFAPDRPWDVTGGRPLAPNLPAGAQEAGRAFQAKFAAHYAVQTLEPDTLAYGLHDSPVGQLAWLLQRWRTWSDPQGAERPGLPIPQMLANATLFWVTETFGAAARFYADLAHEPWTPSHDRTPLVEAPAGFTFLGGDLPAGVTVADRVASFRASRRAARFRIHFARAHARGGHFAHFENPQAVVDDLRLTFRGLRS